VSVPSGVSSLGFVYVIGTPFTGTPLIYCKSDISSASGACAQNCVDGNLYPVCSAAMVIGSSSSSCTTTGSCPSSSMCTPRESTAVNGVAATMSFCGSQLCSAANCATCVSGSSSTCATCKSGYTLSNGACSQTPSTQTCSVANCATCASGSTTTCATCSSGYTLSSGSCVAQATAPSNIAALGYTVVVSTPFLGTPIVYCKTDVQSAASACSQNCVDPNLYPICAASFAYGGSSTSCSSSCSSGTCTQRESANINGVTGTMSFCPKAVNSAFSAQVSVLAATLIAVMAIFLHI